MIQAKPIEILLVEDNPGDVLLTKEALQHSKCKLHLTWVKDGVEALNYLYRQNHYHNAVTPDLILLDLNLPKKDGREVLETIKRDRQLKLIPVIILTSSKAENDVYRSYNLHANCYLTKPVDLNCFINVIQAVEQFWLTVVNLPPKNL
jgi:chemotaxis family two-component system response regulator Rcp1